MSCFMGITEPAIFGVNLRFFKPFICGAAGGACGALYASIVGLGATGTGVTGVFGLLLCLNDPLNYIIMFLISAGSAFALTWVFGYKDPVETKAAPAEEVPIVNETPVTEQNGPKGGSVYAPVTGEAISYTEIADLTFASGVLGKGAGIRPEKGEILALFNGTVTMVFDTKHAIGLESADGTELLIHVGINTVELKGRCFTTLCEAGAKVKQGDKLLEFDIEAIRTAGYDATVAVLASVPENVKDIKTGHVEAGEKLFETCGN